MKFSLSACILAITAISTVHAACHQRSRRQYGAALIPADKQASMPAAAAAVADVQVEPPKKVVRRHKSGRRMDIERRQGPPAPPSRVSVSLHDHNSKNASSTAYDASFTGSSTQSASAAATASSSSASSGSSSSSSSGNYSGQATFFYQDGDAGACGSTHADSAKIVALQTSMYGSGGYCGRTVTITNTANGKSVTATVADECPGCSSSESLDLSTGAFDAIADESTGEVPITWSFS